MRLGNYSARVIVDGKELDEYDVVRECPTKVTCWIASEEGKNFSVEWKCHTVTRSRLLCCSFSMDGIQCGIQSIPPGPLGAGDTGIKSNVYTNGARRDLVFSRIQLTDDDNLLYKKVHRDFGDIHLNLKYGDRVHCRPRPRRAFAGLSGEDKVHERTKKAMVHCVGEAKFVTSEIEFDDDDLGLDLVFKYRPLAVLQANGIAPRPPPSTRQESATELDSLAQNDSDSDSSDNETHELDDIINSLENELRRLRALKASTSRDRKRKRVKKEESEPRKRSLFVTGEVVDLT